MSPLRRLIRWLSNLRRRRADVAEPLAKHKVVITGHADGWTLAHGRYRVTFDDGRRDGELVNLGRRPLFNGEDFMAEAVPTASMWVFRVTIDK